MFLCWKENNCHLRNIYLAILNGEIKTFSGKKKNRITTNKLKLKEIVKEIFKQKEPTSAKNKTKKCRK